MFIDASAKLYTDENFLLQKSLIQHANQSYEFHIEEATSDGKKKSNPS